jgi:hypothetical protein
MTSMKKAEKTIKAIMFDGKHINRFIWKAKFGAKATKLGYYNLLTASAVDVQVPRLGEKNLNYS